MRPIPITSPVDQLVSQKSICQSARDVNYIADRWTHKLRILKGHGTPRGIMDHSATVPQYCAKQVAAFELSLGRRVGNQRHIACRAALFGHSNRN